MRHVQTVKNFQVEMKERGGNWQTLAGGRHMAYNSGCSEHVPAPTCPSGQFAGRGWQLCAWSIGDVHVPSGNADLLGIDGLDVRPETCFASAN